MKKIVISSCAFFAVCSLTSCEVALATLDYSMQALNAVSSAQTYSEYNFANTSPSSGKSYSFNEADMIDITLHAGEPYYGTSTTSSSTISTTSSSSSSTSSSSNSHQAKKCGACGGKGYVIDYVANFGLGNKYCSECGKTVPGGHYHKKCTQCKGTGMR